jgi:hypothetical protein
MEEFSTKHYRPPLDKPLTFVSYQASDDFTAYIEPLAVGDELPEMPLFLSPSFYVSVPLEPTYQAAWKACPPPVRQLVEGSA